MRNMVLWKRVAAVTAIAALAANALALVFYSVFFADRLLLDLVLTTVIVVAIATPMSLAFFLQSMKVERLAERLRIAAETDSLTGLSNRGGFMSDVAAALCMADLVGRPGGALLYLDVDRFKEVNDRHGHSAGDEVLQRIARAIETACRLSDLKGRLGGEEFAVFLPFADAAEAEGASRRIGEAIRACVPAPVGPVTASIGAALHRSGQTLDSLVDEADRNLYAAKRAGRDRAVLPDMEPANDGALAA